VIVLDAGDLLFKKYSAPIPETEIKMATEKAKLIIDSLSLMGYDALAIGDDDLSLGKEFLLEMPRRAKFPFLSSNVIDESSGKPLFQTHVIKKTEGLRIGIFSLLAPETFSNPSDPRKKGLTFLSPKETAQAMVKELQPKTDLIILVSHLGYPKDVELAQTVPGIHFIVGGHTGVNLPYPPIIKNSLIVQMAPKGLYGGRLDLTFNNNEPHFFNGLEKRSFENSLTQFIQKVSTSNVTEVEAWLQYNLGPYSRILHLVRSYQIGFPEDFIQSLRDLIASLKAQDVEKQNTLRVKVKAEAEQILKQLQGRNEFIHNLMALGEQIKDHPEIGKMVETFRSNYPEPEKPAPPRQEAPRPQGGAPQK
jgi:2',3'-cyclic-nucleotide 2'-phosphodiesterase (5'-nucleotidase family)